LPAQRQSPHLQQRQSAQLQGAHLQQAQLFASVAAVKAFMRFSWDGWLTADCRAVKAEP